MSGLREPRVRQPPPHVMRLQRVGFWIAVALGVFYLMHLFGSVLLPFVAGAALAYFLDPIASAWERHHVSRTASALLLLIGFFALCLLVLLLLIPLFRSQIVLLLSRVPDYIATLQSLVTQLTDVLEHRLGPDIAIQRVRQLAANQIGAVVSWMAQSVGTLLTSGVALVNVAMLLVVTPIVAFYLLRDWPKIIAKVESWVPRAYAPTVADLAREIDRILSAWLRGQALCSLILGLFYAVGLSMAGLELGLIVGMTAGILSFIPYVGTMTGGITSIGLALAQFRSWEEVAVVAAVFVAGQILEGYVLAPKLVGSRVELHAVWVMFALLAGGAVYGFLGVLLAVPISASIGVLARFWLRRYMASAFYLSGAPPPAASDLPPEEAEDVSEEPPAAREDVSAPVPERPPVMPG